MQKENIVRLKSDESFEVIEADNQDHISLVLEPLLGFRTTGVCQEKAVCRIGNRYGIFKIHHDERDTNPVSFLGAQSKPYSSFSMFSSKKKKACGLACVTCGPATVTTKLCAHLRARVCES